MALKIAVASGKGGTGKTTVAVNLYHQLALLKGEQVELYDCDVEEPNSRLFFPYAQEVSREKVYQEIPVIDTGRCTFCRACTDYCEFNAILVIPPTGFAEVNASLCHSCGACYVACEHDAIYTELKEIGEMVDYSTPQGKGIREGQLRIGSAMQTMLIRKVKEKESLKTGVRVLDAPPGTSCPVVETLNECDYLLLVTEPTPFGLHDLRLMVNLARDLEIPFGVIINKAGLGDRNVYAYLEKEQIPLMAEIPFDPSFAASYAEGNILENPPEKIRKSFKELALTLSELNPA